MRASYLVKLTAATNKRCQEVAEFIAEWSNALAPDRQLRYVRANDADNVTLAHSYYAEENPDGPGWLVKSKAPYWKYVEFGTLKHGDAQPHVRHAIREAKERFL